MKAKIVILAYLTAVLCLVSCSREIDKVTVSDDIPTPPEAAQGLRIEIGDRMMVLSWDDSGTDIDQYMVYRSDTTASHFELIDSTEVNSYTDYDVQNDVRYFYRVSSVDNTGIEGYPSNPVSGVPSLFSIRIAGDDKYTNNFGVTILPVYSPLTSHIMLSNDAAFSVSKWQTVTDAVVWDLPDQDGPHTVYARFKMANGNETANVVTDDIILDRYASIEVFKTSDSRDVVTTGDTIRFVMETKEPQGLANVEFASLGDLRLFDNATFGDDQADDGIYQLIYVIPPGAEFENGQVTGSFTDAATNVAPEVALDRTISVRIPPDPVTLFLNGAFEDRVELGWTQSQADDFASYRVYRDDNAGVNENSHLVSKLNGVSQLTTTDTLVEPSTTYYYVLVLNDLTGLNSSSNVLEVTTPANEKPNPVVLAFEKTDSTRYELTWTRNHDVDFESYRIYRSTSPDLTNDAALLLAIVNSPTTTTFSGSDEGETYYYRIYVYDRFGLAGDGSNVVPAP